jgi:Flp pilus assembly protein TadD
MLGDALRNAGRTEEAVSAYKKALSLHPQEKRIYSRLGLYQAEHGQLADARTTFERLRQIDPQSEGALSGLGTVAMLDGRPDEARDYFLKTLEAHPASVVARQSLALLAEATNPGEALSRCLEIRQLAPRTPGNDDCIRRNQSRVAATSSTSP